MIRLFIIFFTGCVFKMNAQVISTTKPWAYWWWMGSAVTKEDIKANLTDYARAGIGGLHIIPIYGVKGYEDKFIPFRSKEWYYIVDYTVHEAKSLGLGIDMTLGTGWPYGGPQVSESDAAKKFTLNENGALSIKPTSQKVKRAAPGGEGWVLDHLNKQAVANYISSFEEEFKNNNHGVRAFYNDSYEVYGANWSTDFENEFEKRRGYTLSGNYSFLTQKETAHHSDKLKWIDYHETLSDILLDHFTKPVQSFASKYGKLFRNESHGAPANILDLYAASDIPETEYFGSKSYTIPGVKIDPNYDPNVFGLPGAVVMKLASSAADVTGKKWVSSETATWLGNHFKVSLNQIKPIIDESFIAGVNHIFYHGINYSPKHEVWPGWLFYASTNFNQQSHFWKQLPLLNQYIERCQYYFQNSSPDNDLLVYFPIHDVWANPGNADKLNLMDVHAMQRNGIFKGPLGDLCKQLTNAGYQYDFISDAQLQSCKISNGMIETSGGSKYKGLVIPKSEFMPLNTLRKIKSIHDVKIPVSIIDSRPQFATGLLHIESNQREFGQLVNSLPDAVSDPQSYFTGKVLSADDLADEQLSFIRKRYKSGFLYFIANQNQIFHTDTLQFNAPMKKVILFDAETDRYFNVPIVKGNKLILKIPSGKSVMLFINTAPDRMKTLNNYVIKNDDYSKDITGTWNIRFIEGAPFLPQGFTSNDLTSWTHASDTMSKYFSGTASYQIQFDLDKSWIYAHSLDLGIVHETAEIILNGKNIGTTWHAPFTIDIPQGILKAKNILEIKVTNLSANRIKYIDQSKEPWKKFYDINLVDINYKPFDASGWEPVESGLMGPVKLVKNGKKP